MVAGVIASRVFPAEPLNHRSLATARRPMKRSEIGTLTIMVRRVPVIPVTGRRAGRRNHGDRNDRPSGYSSARRCVDARTRSAASTGYPPASSHGAGPGKSRSMSASIFTRARHTTSTNFRAPRPPHVLLESDRTPTRDRCPFNSPPAPHAHDCVRGELAS